MPAIAALLKEIPEIKDVKISSEAMALWLVGELDPSAKKILTDYGGIVMGRTDGQALFVFLTQDIFLALARLKVWSDINSFPMTAQMFKANLLIGLDMDLGVKVSTELANQDIAAPTSFKIWIQSASLDTNRTIPGFKFNPVEPLPGMSAVPWMDMTADPRMLSQSTMGWYMVLRPLGNPLDKAFQQGWRLFFQEIDHILSRLKLKFIVHDNFLSFKIDNIHDLRQWCTDFLKMVDEAKESALNADKQSKVPGQEKPKDKKPYWPCVMALINSAGIPFSNDLPKKIGLDWEIMPSDFPHMSYRNALLLGPAFYITDARFSYEISGIDDWCTVSLAASGEKSGSVGTIPVDLPRGLVIGPHQPCFYCGQRNHEMAQCPSRELKALEPKAWRPISAMGMNDIKEGLRGIDLAISRQGAIPAITQLLSGQDQPAILTRAIFEITSIFQFRMMTTMWQSRGREYPSGLRQLAPIEHSALFDCLEHIKSGNLLQAERDIAAYRNEHPSSVQAATTYGFLNLEKGDLPKAQSVWKDAEQMSHSPLLQSYHLFLQARCLEIIGKYQAAIDIYKIALSRSPRWREAMYRQCVCLVKMGFAEQSLTNFEQVINLDANIFNRILIDPEMERGHLQLRAMLYPEWEEAQAQVEGTKDNINKFTKELSQWFDLDNPFSKDMLEKTKALTNLSEVKNFVAFRKLNSSRNELSHELQVEIAEQTSLLKEKFAAYLARLQELRTEAGWFPYPKLLMDFNKNFNICAKNSNWAMQQDFIGPESFRKANNLAKQSEETLALLESKLDTLKLLRDGTLFILIMGKTFVWMEIVGLLLSLAILPVAIYYGAEMGMEWAKGLQGKQNWTLQKGFLIILSIVALATSILYAMFTFEKKRSALLNMSPEELAKKAAKKKKKKKKK